MPKKSNKSDIRVCSVLLERTDLRKLQITFNALKQVNAELIIPLTNLAGDNTKLKHGTIQKFPVYKQIAQTESKDHSDQYEFDESDFETVNNRSAVKKNVQKQTRNKPIRKLGKGRKPKKINTYSKRLEEIIKNTILKIEKSKIQTNMFENEKEKYGYEDINPVVPLQRNVKAVKNNKENRSVMKRNVCESNNTVIRQQKQERLYNKSINTTVSIQDVGEIFEVSENSENVPQSSKCKHISKNSLPYEKEISFKRNTNTIPNLQDILDVDDTDDENENHEENSGYPLETNVYKSKETFNKTSKSDKFESHFVCSTPKMQPNIHIISDITLNKDTTSHILQEDESYGSWSLPDANSPNLTTKRSYPWRFNAVVKKNPHYLYIKANSLPSLQQELVLHYNEVKWIEEICAKIARKKKPRTVKQKKNLNDPTNKENIPYSSLFGMEESVTEIQLMYNENAQRRTILGQKNQNTITNYILVGQKIDTPKISAKQQPKELGLNETETKSEASMEKFKDNLSDTGTGPKLFEEDEPSFNLSKNWEVYVPKVRRKRKLFTDNADIQRPEKHKKDAMTKAEEAELDKWASKFNSLCADIEKYELEIE